MVRHIEKTSFNASRCKCLNCPSYSTVCKIKNAHQNTDKPSKDLAERTHYEKMFCAFEKSNCIHLNKGCVCQTCEIFQAYGLNKNTYCLHTGGIK